MRDGCEIRHEFTGIRASRGVAEEHHAKRDTHLATHLAFARVIANERGSAMQDAAVERNSRYHLVVAMTQIVKAIAASLRAQLRRRLPTAGDSGTEKRNDKRLKRSETTSGAEGDRTLYLLHAMQALSQMSYGPCLQLGT